MLAHRSLFRKTGSDASRPAAPPKAVRYGALPWISLGQVQRRTLAPFTITARRLPEATAAEFGIDVHPRAPAVLFPALGAYVGPDIVAGRTPSACARAPSASGPRNTTTDSAERRGALKPEVRSASRALRSRCIAAEWRRSATSLDQLAEPGSSAGAVAP